MNLEKEKRNFSNVIQTFIIILETTVRAQANCCSSDIFKNSEAGMDANVRGRNSLFRIVILIDLFQGLLEVLERG